jgi:hypothetical protein
MVDVTINDIRRRLPYLDKGDVREPRWNSNAVRWLFRKRKGAHDQGLGFQRCY